MQLTTQKHYFGHYYLGFSQVVIKSFHLVSAVCLRLIFFVVLCLLPSELFYFFSHTSTYFPVVFINKAQTMKQLLIFTFCISKQHYATRVSAKQREYSLRHLVKQGRSHHFFIHQ